MKRKRKTAPSKFLTYFQLLDAFREPGCPVCRIVEAGALKALDSLMYEQVNDPGTRDRLVAAHGFCNWHAWMLPRVPNSALGVAVIYRHLLQNTLDRLQGARQAPAAGMPSSGLYERLLGVRRDPPPLLAWRRKKAPCHLCTMSRQSERDLLIAVLDFFGEPEFSDAFTRSPGLCLPHLALALEMGGDRPDLVPLLNAHRTRWENLRWELDEFVRKFDYRYADEIKGREGSSWNRALELFVGGAGLFGPDRGRAASEDLAEPAGLPSDPGRSPDERPERHAEPIDQLCFENDRLKRDVEDLQAQGEEDRRARLALEFQVLTLTAELKAVRMGLEVPAPIQAAPATAPTDGTPAIERPSPDGGASDR